MSLDLTFKPKKNYMAGPVGFNHRLHLFWTNVIYSNVCSLVSVQCSQLIIQKNISQTTDRAFCFTDVLADNGRLTLTGDVITAFGKMMSAHRGEVICSVTTAQVWYGWTCRMCSCTAVLNPLHVETNHLIWTSPLSISHWNIIICIIVYCRYIEQSWMNIYLFQPLDEANLTELKVALKGFLQKGETIKLETKVLCKYIWHIQIPLPFFIWWYFIN